jgi:mannonate dehydratase
VAAGGAAGFVASRGGLSTAATAEPAPTPVLMKLGCQTAPTNDVHLKYLARYRVQNICGYPEIEGERLYATADELKRMIDMAGKHGISIDYMAPFLSSSFIDQEKHPATMLAQSPERDRDIEQLQILIKNCALAGIPSIKYNMSILGVLRTGRIPGRGDAMNHAWNVSEAYPPMPLIRAGRVDADAFWGRIRYFPDRVLLVANEYKIRMACHPQDPGGPLDRQRTGMAAGDTSTI